MKQAKRKEKSQADDIRAKVKWSVNFSFFAVFCGSVKNFFAAPLSVISDEKLHLPQAKGEKWAVGKTFRFPYVRTYIHSTITPTLSLAGNYTQRRRSEKRERERRTTTKTSELYVNSLQKIGALPQTLNCDIYTKVTSTNAKRLEIIAFLSGFP